MILFRDPWFLMLLVLVPLWLRARKGYLRPPSLGFSSTALVTPVAGRGRAGFTWIPTVLKVSVLVLVVAALARPQWRVDGKVEDRDGIRILFLVDTSSSMADHLLDEERSNLDVAKEVVLAFARQRGGDLLGLISFARFPKVECPLTADPEGLAGYLAGLETMPRESPLDGTAVGAALAEAARRLEVGTEPRHVTATGLPAEAEPPRQITKGDSPMDSPEGLQEGMAPSPSSAGSVVVLITDGEENQYTVDPLAAARLLQKRAIKVYAVGAAGSDEDAREGGGPPDFSLHRAVAEMTGGAFAKVSTPADLEAVMQEIDTLEHRPVNSLPVTARIDLFRLLLAPAVLLALIEFLLSRTLFLRIP